MFVSSCPRDESTHNRTTPNFENNALWDSCSVDTSSVPPLLTVSGAHKPPPERTPSQPVRHARLLSTAGRWLAEGAASSNTQKACSAACPSRWTDIRERMRTVGSHRSHPGGGGGRRGRAIRGRDAPRGGKVGSQVVHLSHVCQLFFCGCAATTTLALGSLLLAAGCSPSRASFVRREQRETCAAEGERKCGSSCSQPRSHVIRHVSNTSPPLGETPSSAEKPHTHQPVPCTLAMLAASVPRAHIYLQSGGSGWAGF